MKKVFLAFLLLLAVGAPLRAQEEEQPGAGAPPPVQAEEPAAVTPPPAVEDEEESPAAGNNKITSYLLNQVAEDMISYTRLYYVGFTIDFSGTLLATLGANNGNERMTNGGALLVLIGTVVLALAPYKIGQAGRRLKEYNQMVNVSLKPDRQSNLGKVVLEF